METSSENNQKVTGAENQLGDDAAEVVPADSEIKDVKLSQEPCELSPNDSFHLENNDVPSVDGHRIHNNSPDMPDLPIPSIEQPQDFDEDEMLNMLHEFNNYNNATVDEEAEDGFQRLSRAPSAEATRIEEAVAQAEFQERKKVYDEVVRRGENTQTDDIEFARAEEEEYRRQKIMQKEQEYRNTRTFRAAETELESNPFFFTPADDLLSANDIEIPIGYDEIPPQNLSKRGRKPAAQRNPNGVQQGRVEKKKDTKTPRGRRRRRSPELLNMRSLVHNDIVGDARANQGHASQPSFTARNRKKALDQLLSSIPEEHQQLHKHTVKHLEAACKKFTWRGAGSMYSHEDGRWRLKGMKTSLYHFQLLGCAWMRDKENGSKPPFGGIIADSMGLGKTITTICNMIEGRPKENARNQTTLIVTPSSLCDQWMTEITKHCEPHTLEKELRGVTMYGPKCRPKSSDICGTLKKFGVIITTYAEVMNQFPKCDPPAHIVSEAEKDKWWKAKFEKEKGPLFRIAFHRVMLDEAQTIKNHHGRTSKACRLLYSKYRWIITGTPLSNRIEELYPYFEFIGVQGSGSFEAFKQNFGKRDDACTKRLDSILRQVMIRRTNADRMFGRPIVKLPALNHEVISIPFDRVERMIYQIVHARFLARLNQWKMEGTVLKQGATIFAMLTRLRQMCAHILLISKCLGKILEAEDIEKICRLLKQVPRSGERSTSLENGVVLGHFLEDARNTDNAHEETMLSDDATSNQGNDSNFAAFPMSVNFCGFLQHLLKDGNFAELAARSLCHKCKQPPLPSDRRLTVPCCHMYCEQCLTSMLNEATNTEACVLCLHCSAVITGQETFRNIPDSAFNSVKETLPKDKARSKGSKPDEYAWINTPGTLMSSKVKAVIQLIDDWFKKHPESKVIVFVQWIGMIEVLAKICNIARWGCCKYIGKMSREARLKSIEDFQDSESGKRVLLSSLRCGGVGLNLTMGRFVIIVDPWWNEAAEDQAFSRAYRIGQKHDVEVRKLIIEDTVETELILALQKMKTKEINRTLNEDERPKDKYDVEFLLKLFGPAERDPITGEKIVTDTCDTEDEFILASDQMIVDDSDVEDPNFTPAKPF